MSRGPVALLTAGPYAHLDEDLPLLVDALGALGIAASPVDWHDGSVDWAAHALVVIRSPWDYTDQLDGFLAALHAIDAATTLANPLEVVRANVDKRYLARLAAAGTPVVPTTVLEPGDALVLGHEGPLVVKPTVSAGARDTERYAADELDAARQHATRLLAAGRSVLVQPYVATVDERGETGLVFLGDRFSHAFRKGPILRPDAAFVEGLYREEEIEPRIPTDAELAVAESVLDALGAVAPGWTRRDLLYARIDLVEGVDGPLLLELELTEPSLFLNMSTAAPERAAAAIADRLT